MRHKRCFISTCRSVSSRSFHEFPSNMTTRAKWLQNLELSEDREIPDTAVICSIHFENYCYKDTSSRRKLLLKEAVPTLCLGRLPVIENTMKPSVSVQSFLPAVFNRTLLSTANNRKDATAQVNVISKKQIDEYRAQVKALKLQVKRLITRNEVKAKKINEINAKVSDSDIEALFKIKQDVNDDNLRAKFLMEEIRNYETVKNEDF